jgi:hypothetical protein
MPHKLCVEPRCPNYVRPRSSLCDFRARKYERERWARRRAQARALRERPLGVEVTPG